MNDIYHIIFNLLDEISTEIDLHYEDEQAAGLMHTFTRIKPAADWLTANGHDLPDPYRHILQRFEPALTDNLH